MDNDNEIEIRERLTAVEQSTKQAHHRLNEVQDLVKAVYNVANEVKYMRENLNETTARLDRIEQKPSKRYELIVTTIITAIVGGLVGFIISRFLG